MQAYMKFVFFVFFPVSDSGENGLGDEGADRGNAPTPRIFGQEPPLEGRLNSYLYF